MKWRCCFDRRGPLADCWRHWNGRKPSVSSWHPPRYVWTWILSGKAGADAGYMSPQQKWSEGTLMQNRSVGVQVFRSVVVSGVQPIRGTQCILTSKVHPPSLAWNIGEYVIHKFQYASVIPYTAGWLLLFYISGWWRLLTGWVEHHQVLWEELNLRLWINPSIDHHSHFSITIASTACLLPWYDPGYMIQGFASILYCWSVYSCNIFAIATSTRLGYYRPDIIKTVCIIMLYYYCCLTSLPPMPQVWRTVLLSKLPHYSCGCHIGLTLVMQVGKSYGVGLTMWHGVVYNWDCFVSTRELTRACGGDFHCIWHARCPMSATGAMQYIQWTLATVK
jgi:hypothetical protein